MTQATQQGGTSPDQGALGINTECSSGCSHDRAQIRENRGERYRLQAQARELLMSEGRVRGLDYPENHHRTAKCHHTPIGQPGVRYDPEHGSAFYSGLATCGNVWACPICAAKVQERRREEIAQGFKTAYSQGLKVVMVTLTFPHGHGDDLRGLMTKQSDALRRLRSGDVWQRIKRRTGFRGLIRSLELTLGPNGWHPHTHEAWIVSVDCDAEALADDIRKRWAASCRRAGLLPPERERAFQDHAVDVIDRAACSDYLAKHDAVTWGADRELASARTKAGKREGRHPFQLLEAAATDDAAAARYLEYVEAMRGKRQLFWSQGLKDWAGINDISDEEAAVEGREEVEQVCLIDRHDWYAVRMARRRAELLTVAEVEGVAGITRVVAECRAAQSPPPTDYPVADAVGSSLKDWFVDVDAARQLYT